MGEPRLATDAASDPDIGFVSCWLLSPSGKQQLRIIASGAGIWKPVTKVSAFPKANVSLSISKTAFLF